MNISSGLYSFNICQRFSLIISSSSSSALAASPYILYCLRLCHFLKLFIQPLNPLNLSSFNKKAKLKAFVERISLVIMRLALSVLSTHITNASLTRGNGVFLSYFKLAWYELVSTESQRSFSFKISLTMPSLTSYSLAKSFCFKKGDDIFFKQSSFFCTAVRDFHFFLKVHLVC